MWLKTGMVGLWISGQVDTGEGWGLFTPVRRHGGGGKARQMCLLGLVLYMLLHV